MGSAARAFYPFSRREARREAAHSATSWLALIFTLAFAISLSTSPALALTPAGTVITNVATATYDGGSVTSNAASFTVAQIAGAQLAPTTGAATGRPGTTLYFPVTITNTGNGTDVFTLTGASTVGWPVLIYLDDNADGLHQDSEVTAIRDSGSLPMGGQAACFVAVTIPSSPAGVDTVSFTATSTFDPTCSASAAYVVDLVSPLLADFRGSPTNGTAPLTVSFADASTGGPTSWSWDFGDGGSSTEQNPTHVYASAGTYSVTLTVANASDRNTQTKAGYIVVSVAPPKADFTASPTSGPAPLTVQFTNLSTGNPTSWRWDFGDAQSSTAQNPSHVYASPGTYAVSLTATNAGGQNTATKSGYITVSVPAPVADFTASPTSGPAPLTVSFTDRSTGSPTSWSWTFGDGQSSSGQNPTHVYAAPGTYTVTLTVANDGGDDAETKTGCITVSPAAPATAEFIASPLNGPAPLNVQFTDLSTGNPTSWLWDFGDGQSSADQNPVHTYQVPGTYTVSLSIVTATGPASRTKPVYIIAGFTDVAVDFWAYHEIMVCLKEGLVEGYADGTFRPSIEIARDAMAVYLARALAGGDANVPAGPDVASFQDVPTSYWAYKYVEYAKALTVILGFPDGLFHPTKLVTRADMAVFLARALVYPTGEDGLRSYVPPATPTFSDVTSDNQWSWCYKHVEFLAARAVVTGYPDGTYRPGQNVTRDQLAVYLVRGLGLSPSPTLSAIMSSAPVAADPAETGQSGPLSQTRDRP